MKVEVTESTHSYDVSISVPKELRQDLKAIYGINPDVELAKIISEIIVGHIHNYEMAASEPPPKREDN